MSAAITSPEQLKELLGIPFTDQQVAAITAPTAPAVVVAGAGSGKTTVMAARVVWLVGRGLVRPEQVLGLTFTNKAAGELSERVRTALARAGVSTPEPADEGDAPGDPEISTYHAFAGRLLKEHGLRIGIEPDVRLLADATRFQLAARVLGSARGPYRALTGTVSSLVAELLALDGELAEHLVTPERLRDHDRDLLDALAAARLTNEELRRVPEAARGRLELLGLVEEYRRRKQAAGLMDFGDQIAAAATLAQTRPEVGRLLRDQYRVVLLDEYQDTSVAQRLLLAGLFGRGPEHPGGHPVTAVGDPCQAIYGWRGASVANLDEFPEHFPHADGRPAARYSLSENRRSGGRLLDFANRLAEPLRAMHEGVEALRPAPGAEHDGFVRCALLPTHAEEVEWLADSIAHLVRTGTAPGRIAVLCRGGAAFPDVHAALTARDVPVEVVGLSGLLHLPEVADLVATCEVLQDPTANAALVRLLVGPRWRIGPRDLALLGRRARDLVRVDRGGDPADRLADAVAEADPTEVVSLADALETFLHPGGVDGEDELPFSPEARVRFARLAREIRDLRRSLAEPLMDVLHRVLAATGLDVELAASPHALAARRRETLHAFLDVAASFADLDGDPSLGAFLAFLRAAQEYDRGLDGTLPGGDDTVKVLTAHKAKGLEWDVVAVPGLVQGAFPSTKARERWTARRHVLPHALRGDADTLPPAPEWTARGMKGFAALMKEQAATEELRLGYVAFTRPRGLLLASGHWWGASRRRPAGPSDFLLQLRDHCERPGGLGEVEAWAEPPGEDEENPALGAAEQTPWPLPLDPAAMHARRLAARTVLARLDGHPPAVPPAPPTPEERRLVESWDRDLAALLGELERSRRAVRDVPVPPSLSASQLMRLAADPDGFARDLARPMPRPPQPAARRGTRFHAWVESRFEPLMLVGPDELPGEDDDGIEDERDLARLKEAFLRTPYAHRTPHRVEAPFQLVLAGRVVRGRIDAVYRCEGGDGTSPGAPRFEVVDWKTGRREDADPLQLAVYRLAWAEQQGLPPEQVTAAFLYVRSGRVEYLSDLPDRTALERILTGNSEEWVTESTQVVTGT
ncbi:ATP-dependent helicase [Streptacidiphilus sp. ASG 303]|uniref:ATP-dependent DNA helicase n=1 Tax=Streptacidiphilus sp. ASG 303 TaxID=2896847 RepID=UPI001E320474|nr:ATP-dependent DNA helicase [Streptacidiphilus sp. ASG 303]MCD0482813.1 ATP-dependent helicase [Streptacidiphilus sp. ASG 303]